MPDRTSQNDRFHPAMPRIPGVSDRPPETHDVDTGEANDREPRWSGRWLTVVAAGIVLAGAFGWWTLQAKRGAAKLSDPANPIVGEGQPEVTADEFAGESAQDATAGVSAAATLAELAKPWSAKRFTFVNPETHERVPAMIVRLPGANTNSREDYWAFSLNAPYKTCQLDYVPDLAQLAARYAYRARHPMVVASCDGTLYDPLRIGTTPEGAWVRGEVEQGPGIRPPISIEIHVQGSRIVADRIE